VTGAPANPGRRALVPLAALGLLALAGGVWDGWGEDARNPAPAAGSVAAAAASGISSLPAATAASGHASSTSSAPTAVGVRRVQVFIGGNVQGVGFRAFVEEQARPLKLTGFVRNLADGRVELVAEGSAADVEKLLSQARHGPPSARVDAFECKDQTPSGEFDRFEIRY
jgi:acylphosphatase